MLTVLLLLSPSPALEEVVPPVVLAKAADAELRRLEGRKRTFKVAKDSLDSMHEGRVLYEVKGRRGAHHYTVWLRADRDADEFSFEARLTIIRHEACQLHPAFTEYRLMECDD